MRTDLPPAFEAPRKDWHSPGQGRVSYYSDEGHTGTPLLLVHSINAAPSAYEMKPLFEHYREKRPVYAPDLPGFGGSERRDCVYTPDLFANALKDFIKNVIGAPTDVIALSTSAEFAARASISGALIRSLTLISPTGFTPRKLPSTKVQHRVHSVLRTPVLGSCLYWLLTVKPSVRYFLNMGFTGRAPDAMVDYAQRSTRQPGARHAPFYFLSLQLFSPDAVNQLYLHVDVPTLVLYDEDPNISFERLPEVTDNRPNWQTERIAPTLGLPHWEQPVATRASLDRFWTTT